MIRETETYTLAVADLSTGGRGGTVSGALVDAFLEDVTALSAASGRDGVGAEEGEDEAGEDSELHCDCVCGSGVKEERCVCKVFVVVDG